MNDRDNIKEIYEQIKPKQELIGKTSLLMKEELNRQQDRNNKNPAIFRRYTRQIAVVTCIFVIVFGSMHIYNSTQPQISTDNNKILMSKAMVNVTGQIEEVSEDGYSFRVNGIWYLVDDNTKYLSQSGENVSKVFDIGNNISAYTSEKNKEDYRLIDTVYSNRK